MVVHESARNEVHSFLVRYKNVDVDALQHRPTDEGTVGILRKQNLMAGATVSLLSITGVAALLFFI